MNSPFLALSFSFVLTVSSFLSMSQKRGKNPCLCVYVGCPTRTLHRGPVSHIGVCPRMSRAGAHNSGAVGGGWRKPMMAACDAERWRHSGEGCEDGLLHLGSKPSQITLI